MKKTLSCVVVLLGLGLGASAVRAAAVDDLLAAYTKAGAGPFDAAAGKKLFTEVHKAKRKPIERRCVMCHTTNLRATGKHFRTGKRIKPMAPSVNPRRFTKVRKVKKWLRRNCKWTIGRLCTAQEKGDLLTFLRAQ